MRIIYINYINMQNTTSGSTVRPTKIYKAMIELGYEVELITGETSRHNITERKKYLKSKMEIISKNSYDYCYIEPMTSSLFKGYNNYEYNFIKNIYKKKIPIGVFYRDVYWKFKQLFGLKGIRQFVIKQFQKKDINLYKRICKCVFLPSLKMNDYCDFKTYIALPPACESIDFTVCDDFLFSAIYVGGVNHNYGTDMMIDAFRIVNKIKKIKLNLICRKDDLLYLNSIINESDAQWLRVIQANSEQLYSIYLTTDVAIYPLRKNNYHDFALGVKMFEYLANIKPIVATNCSEIQNIIQSNNLGITCNDNCNDLANAIIEMYSSIENYRTYTINQIKFVENNKWIDRVRKISETLVKEK